MDTIHAWRLESALYVKLHAPAMLTIALPVNAQAVCANIAVCRLAVCMRESLSDVRNRAAALCQGWQINCRVVLRHVPPV